MSTVGQLDLFGNVVPEVPRKKGWRKRYKTMQEMYGVIDGKTCKTCQHCVRCEYNRVYYKCELWHISSSAATDIRLKNQACTKYEEDK